MHNIMAKYQTLVDSSFLICSSYFLSFSSLDFLAFSEALSRTALLESSFSMMVTFCRRLFTSAIGTLSVLKHIRKEEDS